MDALLNAFANWLGLSGWPAAAFLLLVPMIIPIGFGLIRYRIEKGIDAGQNAKIAKLEAELDATQSKLQTNLDVKSHVTRTQFDVEFRIYRELWSKISSVESLAVGLDIYCRLGTEKSAEEKQKNLDEQIENFRTSVGDCLNYIDQNSIAIPSSLDEPMTKYSVLQVSLIHEFHKYFLSLNLNTDDPSKEVARYREQIKTLKVAIRERLAKVEVIV